MNINVYIAIKIFRGKGRGKYNNVLAPTTSVADVANPRMHFIHVYNTTPSKCALHAFPASAKPSQPNLTTHIGLFYYLLPTTVTYLLVLLFYPFYLTVGILTKTKQTKFLRGSIS